MKKTYYIIIIILFSWNLPLLSQIQIQNSGVNVTLWDVFFLDSLCGWAVGDSGLVISTTNGGNTWEMQRTPVETITLEKVCFINHSVGYIVGRSGTILSTKDGGVTWIVNNSGVDYRLTDISFVNIDTGWVSGGDFFKSRKWGVILHTKDGGHNWEKQLEIYSPSIFESKLFSAVEFIDEMNGWAFASDHVDNFSLNYVYRTFNGGENWFLFSVMATPMISLNVVSIDTLWAGGFAFAKSYDGGITWSYSGGNISFGSVWDIQPLSGTMGWVGARYLVFTHDGMQTWSQILDNQKFGLNALTNIGLNNLIAAGDSGIIVYLSGIDSIEKRNDVPEIFRLYQNFPNPFNSSTTIQFDIYSTDYVTLIIYDITGKMINTLISQFLVAGNYKIVWMGKDSNRKPVPSGIYFYQLKFRHHNSTKKMILIR